MRLQFVPFQRFRGNSIQLTAEVLAEIPDQVIRYMMDNKFAPRPNVLPPHVSVESSAPSAPPLTPTAASSSAPSAVASFASLPPPPGPPPPAAQPPLPQGSLLRLVLLILLHGPCDGVALLHVTFVQAGLKFWILPRSVRIM